MEKLRQKREDDVDLLNGGRGYYSNTCDDFGPADVTVVIGTFGEFKGKWQKYVQRAWRSVEAQTVRPRVLTHVHDGTLAMARNQGGLNATTEWVIFLDADDELDPLYVESMLAATGDVRRPATLGIYEDGRTDDYPVMIPRKPLLDANFIVIGAMVRADMVRTVEGFDEYPMSEDWAFWIKCWLEGAVISDVPDAIYRVNVVPGSRNSDSRLGGKVYNQIKARFVPEARSRGIV